MLQLKCAWVHRATGWEQFQEWLPTIHQYQYHHEPSTGQGAGNSEGNNTVSALRAYILEWEKNK